MTRDGIDESMNHETCNHKSGAQIREEIATRLEAKAYKRQIELAENAEAIAMVKDYWLEDARIGQMHQDAQWIRGQS